MSHNQRYRAFVEAAIEFARTRRAELSSECESYFIDAETYPARRVADIPDGEPKSLEEAVRVWRQRDLEAKAADFWAEEARIKAQKAEFELSSALSLVSSMSELRKPGKDAIRVWKVGEETIAAVYDRNLGLRMFVEGE